MSPELRADPATVLQLLYDHEMAYAITARWDTGFTAELLTLYSPMPVSPPFLELAQAADWLAAEAIRRHPKSAFAAKYEAISAEIDDPATPNPER
jgi:hypothetical protein